MRKVIFLIIALSCTTVASAIDWTDYMGIYIFSHVESKSIYNGNIRQVDFDSSKERFQDNPYCRIEIGADWVGVPNYVYKIVNRKVKEDGTLILHLKDDAWQFTATLEILPDKNINMYLTDDGEIAATTWYTRRYTFKPYDIFRGTISDNRATLVSYPIEDYNPNKENFIQADLWYGDNLSSVTSLSGEFSHGPDLHITERDTNGRMIAEWFCMILPCDNTSNKVCITGSMIRGGQTYLVDLTQK